MYSFTAKLWQYNGKNPWCFVNLPRHFTEEIKSLTSGLPHKGFGTVKVKVTSGDISWTTSIFPDRKSNSYLLPIKKEVRNKLAISDGESLSITVEIMNL